VVPLLERKLRAASLPKEAEDVAQRELKRLRRMSPMHSEYSTLVDYLEWIAELPWNVSSPEMLSIGGARRQLEQDHFGMDKVKARILEYLAVCKLKGDTKGSLLCMLGPPGIGKTSLGKSIADALHRDFYRVSLGGIHSEAEVRGHRRTYVGALPGLILQAVKKCGSNNCVIMLDEVDKLGRSSHNGDPASALLEVLDPEQNQNFRDHFLSLPFNLSRVLFIATANEIEPIPRPLRDRMEVIEMTGYTVEEKTEIATRHLLPKQLREHGLTPEHLTMDTGVMDALISGYTMEAGVRELERQLAAICRSVAARVARASESDEDDCAAGATAEDGAAANGTADGADSATAGSSATDAADGGASADGAVGEEAGVAAAGDAAEEDEGRAISVERLSAVLGPPKFDGLKDTAQRISRPGIATGLAYTSVGGAILFVEAERMGGSGQLMLTGQLGDVMQESAKAALSWIRSHAIPLGLSASGTRHLFNATDLHIHFPAGAMPKDGPSAGVTITTALVSLLTGRTVRSDVAMTGEVTLRGNVLPVGGIKEKVVAAHRAGIRDVIMPAKNEKDLQELPPSVLAGISFTFVTHVEQVLQAALLPSPDAPALAAKAAAHSPGDAGGETGGDGAANSGGGGGGLGGGGGEPQPPEPQPLPQPRLAAPAVSAATARRAAVGGSHVLRARRGD